MEVKIYFILLIFIFKSVFCAQVLTEEQLRLLLSNFDDRQMGSIYDEMKKVYETGFNSSPQSTASVDDIIEMVDNYPDLYITSNLGVIFENLFEILTPEIKSEY
jgi:hypothetical protein